MARRLSLQSIQAARAQAPHIASQSKEEISTAQLTKVAVCVHLPIYIKKKKKPCKKLWAGIRYTETTLSRRHGEAGRYVSLCYLCKVKFLQVFLGKWVNCI